jgi:hypothetical protein
MTPSGILLGFLNSVSPNDISVMLRHALAKWEQIPREHRLLSINPEPYSAYVQRRESQYPRNGLALRVYARDLPRAASASDWRGRAWNQDYAWFTREEMRRFLPMDLRPGARALVAEPLARRLARAHLVDMVRGETSPFADAHIRQAWLTTTVTGVNRHIVTLRLEGVSHTDTGEPPPARGRHPSRSMMVTRRGFSGQLLGTAQYDTAKGRFISFELVALGYRWGATPYNGRADDLAPSPIGFAFTLAGNTAAERIPPAYYWAYR